MLSINGTTNYNTANIEGKTFTDTTADVTKLKFDTQAISYNDITNTTNIASNLAVTGTSQLTDVNIVGTLSIPSYPNVKVNLDEINAKLTDISYNAVTDTTSVSGNLNVTGITDTTRLQADNLILGTATYNAGVQFKMNGVMNIGDQVNLNSQSRTLNIRDTNGLISIGRYSSNAPGFELRNFNPTGGALRQDVLFLGPSFAESWSWLFRTPGAGGDYTGGFFTRSRADFYTPIYVGKQLSGTAYISRWEDTVADNKLDIYLNPTASMYNSLVQAGDIAMIGLGSVNNTRNITIGTQNSTGTGIRLTSTSGITVGGNTTFTSGSNIIQSGTGIISQSGSGTNNMKGITLNGNDDFTQSGSGIISQTGSGTNLLKDTSITGVLGITGYSNVKTTLDTLSASTTATTGITYNAGTDTTTIDNNVTITNNKTLTLQDVTTQKTAFRPDVLNECEINFLVNVGISLDPVLFATFNLGEQPSALVGPGSNIYFFTAIKLVKNEVYKGIGLYIGTVGNWECALYPRGSNGSRIAITAITASVANRMNYFNFTPGTYTHTGDTDIFYIAYRTTSAAQTNLYAPINTFLNYNNTTAFNGILNKRCQTASSGAASFPATLIGVGTMAANSYLPYAILYGPEPPPLP